MTAEVIPRLLPGVETQRVPALVQHWRFRSVGHKTLRADPESEHEFRAGERYQEGTGQQKRIGDEALQRHE